MKTKIIYISGNEVFEMADIRAAFEEVRATLGLGADTVMFGVPVDADDALAATTNIPEPVICSTEINIENKPADTETFAEPVIETAVEDKPKKTPKRGRPKKAEIITDDIAPETEQIVPDESSATENIADVATADDEQKKVIPILSVLATKAPDTETDNPTIPDDIAIPDIPVDDVPAATDDASESDTAIIADLDINAELATTAMDQDLTDAPQKVSIGDMLNDDAPVQTHEKTLEELLESMTPLREDHDIPAPADDVADIADTQTSDDFEIAPTAQTASDATLEKLAAEFAQTEDTIPPAPRTQSHGKIGKLKNILPFKKAKHDDAGLMGDLFGWAGIAANDEDFSIPGFFTPTAAKK